MRVLLCVRCSGTASQMVGHLGGDLGAGKESVQSRHKG